MSYNFILQNVYFKYIDPLQTFGMKPYLTANVGEICPQLPPILDVMCYEKSKDINKMTQAFQALTKCLGRPVERIFPPKILHQKDILISPLIPVNWAFLFNIKANLECKYFSDHKYNVFKKGKIIVGQRQYSLDNVVMSDELYPPFKPTLITCISDLKPLCIAEQVPISFQTFYVLMFQPRKIRQSDLKTYLREQKNALSFLDDKLRWPVFKIPVPETIEKQEKTDSKAIKDKLVLSQ